MWRHSAWFLMWFLFLDSQPPFSTAGGGSRHNDERGDFNGWLVCEAITQLISRNQSAVDFRFGSFLSFPDLLQQFLHLSDHKCIRSHSAIPMCTGQPRPSTPAQYQAQSLTWLIFTLRWGLMHGSGGNWRVHAFQWMLMAICNNAGCSFLPTSCVFSRTLYSISKYIFVLQILKY